MNKTLKRFGRAVLLAALLLGTGLAQDPDTDTTAITGDVTYSIDVVAPSTIDDWTLVVGSNTYTIAGPAYPQVTVSTNYYAESTNLRLQVSDERTMGSMTAGHMTDNVDPTSATDELNAAMTVGFGTDTPVTLSATETDINTTPLVSGGTQITGDVKFNQEVAYNDPTGNVYMTVTFTGTVAV